ncbi:MAG: SurA N-terminal domain-containing protein [Candidatus Omnitrophota bacterium]|nr:SurA N-terminal domain-containing protein [Candidatus Omnitrophota bacterium]
MRLLCIGLCVLLFSGCSSGKGQNEKVVAQVNKYKMTIGDLVYEFKNAPYDETALLKTEKGRREYLDGIIEKEVLLQEAQRLGIDRERDFMKSIENYWEQALLRILLERKSKEISGLIHVYDNEIEKYYKDSGENQPFSRVKNEIRDTIKQKKETEAMDAWMSDLKKRSYIKIDNKAAGEMLLNAIEDKKER